MTAVRRAISILIVATGLVTLSIVAFVSLSIRDHPTRDRPTKSVADENRGAEAPRSTAIRLRPMAGNAASGESELLMRKRTPAHDDWETEVQSDAVIAQLNTLADWLESGDLPTENQVGQLAERSFRFTLPDLENLTKVYDQGGITTFQATTETSDSSEQSDTLRVFLQAMRLIQPILKDRGPMERHAKFKLFRIKHTGDGSETETLVRFELSRLSPSTSEQQTAIWKCHWRFPRTAGGPPLLASVAVQRFEQVTVERTTLFGDSTQSVLGDNESYATQMLPGIPSWLARLPKEFFGQFGHHGLTIGDVNGDGYDDIYVCDAGGLPNRLYVQQADGTALDVSAKANVDFLEDSVSALLVDIDNDGDQDLVVAMDPLLRIAENDGTGQFTLRTAIQVDTDSFSLSAADFDSDGDLDIYVCGYNVRKDEPTDRSLPFPIPYHDANNGGRNALLRNDGDFRFTDVTDAVGLAQNNSRFSMAAAWDDFDNDGDLDLYVANDFGRNNLYRNDNGRFIDVGAMAGVEDHASGMSVACGDFNRDGNVDIYVGNMFSAAGNRITYQRRFGAGAGDETVRQLQGMARGNTLFANAGDGTFRDVSEPQNVAMGRWAWGSQFVDFTNDGWLDLIVANGYVTNEDDADL